MTEEQADQPETDGKQPTDGDQDKRPFVWPVWLNIVAGVILLVGGYMFNNVTRSIHDANALHSKGARFTINGFTLALKDVACGVQPVGFLPPKQPGQNCVATFDVFNNTNNSKSLNLDFTLYVGPARYKDDFSSTGDVFPNSRTTSETSFDIAPGTAPTKLKATPSYPSFWNFLPWHKQQFYWDLR